MLKEFLKHLFYNIFQHKNFHDILKNTDIRKQELHSFKAALAS